MVTFVDWNSVGDTISGVENDTGGTTGSVEGKDGLDSDVHGGGVEGFEHDLEAKWIDENGRQGRHGDTLEEMKIGGEKNELTLTGLVRYDAD